MGLYTIASALFILSIFFPVLISIGGSLLGFQHTSNHTAIAMFLPLIVSMPLIVGSIILQKQKPIFYFIILILFGITICWLANYFWETFFLQTSEFDKKRIWFFFHGFLLPGLIGSVVSRKHIAVIQKFILSFVIATGLSSLLYISSYDFNLNFVRLLGEMGLVAGIMASFGSSACLSMLILEKNTKKNPSNLVSFTIVVMIFIHFFSIILSGTRAAIIGFAVSLVLYLAMSQRKKGKIFLLFILLILSFFLYDFIDLLVPHETIHRLGMFYDQGIEIRIRLLKGIAQIISENPLGKVTGYENSILGMAYSHNAIIQLIAEAGVLSIPALATIIILSIKNTLALRQVVQIKALFILFANVFIQSFSSGSAYNPLLWFLLFFFASLQCQKNYSYSLNFGRIWNTPRKN